MLLVRQALHKPSFTKITALPDKKATRIGILRALDSLKNQCLRGDIMVIHFPSHCQQISDNNNDALEEAIVFYGAPDDTTGQFAKYYGSEHLRDEDLGQRIDQIRRQLGPKAMYY